MKRKILRDTDTISIPITITVAMRRFALVQSTKFDGCKRPEAGSISHFFNTLAKEYATRIGIKAEGISKS